MLQMHEPSSHKQGIFTFLNKGGSEVSLLLHTSVQVCCCRGNHGSFSALRLGPDLPSAPENGVCAE